MIERYFSNSISSIIRDFYVSGFAASINKFSCKDIKIARSRIFCANKSIIGPLFLLRRVNFLLFKSNKLFNPERCTKSGRESSEINDYTAFACILYEI